MRITSDLTEGRSNIMRQSSSDMLHKMAQSDLAKSFIRVAEEPRSCGDASRIEASHFPFDAALMTFVTPQMWLMHHTCKGAEAVKEVQDTAIRARYTPHHI